MPALDPGSFRDPASQVVIDGERVLRLLDDRGLAAWRALSSSRFFAERTQSGDLILAEESSSDIEGAAAVLEHPRLPMITYPYEWTFGMLKDAALLQLDLLSSALDEGLTIKDATPFNIQFAAGRPRFIDIGSFEVYEQGEPWIGYRQFTRQFLFPLMLRAWVGVPSQPWVRGDMEGPTAAQMQRLLSTGQRLKPAAMMHVSLQARLERATSGEAVRSELKSAGFGAEMIQVNVKRLRNLIAEMEPQGEHGVWAAYNECAHVGRDRDTKTRFLQDALEADRPGRVLDLGANDGHFSIVAAAFGAHAVAVDADETVLDALYRSSEGRDISIALSDLANPSPSQGWAGVERPSLFDRARPGLIIAYGVIHHLIYTSSIPPAKVIDWLAGFGCPVVLEYVSPEDEMVRRLTVNKLEAELHPHRDEAGFRVLVESRFDVSREKHLESGTRRLFHLAPR